MWTAGTQLFEPAPAASQGACEQEAGVESGVRTQTKYFSVGWEYPKRWLNHGTKYLLPIVIF